MRRMNGKTALGLVAALSLVVLAQPVVAGHKVKLDKDVKVKVIKCKDGDCEEMIENIVGAEGKKIFVGGEDGEKKIVIRKVHCDGEDCEEQMDSHKMVFVGEDGNVQIKTGDGANSWVSHDCDGDDCAHENVHKMIFVGEDGDVQVMGGGEGHAWVSHDGIFGMGGGFLGVGLTELTPELREHFGVPADAGVMVSKVMADSPAFKAGLEVGDIIASVDNKTIAGGSALAKNIRGRDAGEEVVLNVWRNGSVRSVTAAIETRKGGGLHAEHMGDMHKKMRKIMIECDSEEEDCGSSINIDVAGASDFDCDGADECEVKVECDGDGCTCTVNGEDADCSGIPGVPGQ